MRRTWESSVNLFFLSAIGYAQEFLTHFPAPTKTMETGAYNMYQYRYQIVAALVDLATDLDGCWLFVTACQVN